MSTVREVQVTVRPRVVRDLLTMPGRLANPVFVFVLLSLTFGTAIVAMTPPLRGPDEAAHFLRAYGLAQGEIIPSQADREGRKGIFLPARLYRHFAIFEARFAHERAPFRETGVGPSVDARPVGAQPASVFVHYAGSEGYAPVPYLPHAAAALVARLLGLDFVATLYLMRLAGLAATTLVTAYAIMLAPTVKWAFVAIAMLPAALYGRAMINADGAALALTMLVAALCLGTALPERRSPHALWMALCVLSKPSNLALIALATMRAPLQDVIRYWRSVAFVVMPAAAAALVWSMTSRVDAGTWRLVELTGRPPEQFDPIWKLGFMLEHPLHFPSATIASFSDPGELWRQLIGVLGLFDTVLHPWVYPVLSITLVIACISRVELSPQTRSWTAIAATAGATGYALSVFLIFYLVWTPIDADQVWGVQGRYFLPALPPLAIAAACFIRRSLGEAAQAVSAGGGALLSGAACVEAIWRVEWMI